MTSEVKDSVARRGLGAAPVVSVKGLRSQFGEQVVHENLNLEVCAGELVALIGGSGSGKSLLLRQIVGLLQPQRGEIQLLGTQVNGASERSLESVRCRVGMLFQDGALFSSLTVAQNIAVPMRESGLVPEALVDSLVFLRMVMAGLPLSTAAKMPSELSGGMRKRAGIARALALEPEVLFLDEPTSGLDPLTARALDRQILSLCDDLGLTVFVITHDLDTLFTIARRIVVLGRGRVLADGTLPEILAVGDPWIEAYFSSRVVGAERSAVANPG